MLSLFVYLVITRSTYNSLKLVFIWSPMDHVAQEWMQDIWYLVEWERVNIDYFYTSILLDERTTTSQDYNQSIDKFNTPVRWVWERSGKICGSWADTKTIAELWKYSIRNRKTVCIMKYKLWTTKDFSRESEMGTICEATSTKINFIGNTAGCVRRTFITTTRWIAINDEMETLQVRTACRVQC